MFLLLTLNIYLPFTSTVIGKRINPISSSPKYNIKFISKFFLININFSKMIINSLETFKTFSDGLKKGIK